MRFAFALFAISLGGTPGLHAETLRAGNGAEHQDVCSAIAAAHAGDTVEVSGPASTSDCTWTTSNLTIKGVGSRPVITAESGASGWSIAADHTVIENLSFAGSRCAKGECVALELHSGQLTLRNVSITGSDIGVRAHNSEAGALTIDRCEIAGNGSNIDVEHIARFVLSSSYVHNALGGALVKTSAQENSILNNRIASGSEASASGELVIAGSTKTDVSGNVLVRANGGSTAGLIQYIDVAGRGGEIVAERNTFVNATTSGIEFIESIGDRAPSLRLEGNVFWGDTSAGRPVHADAGVSNYFGLDDVFRGDNDFRLNGHFVPANTGAVATDDTGFPLNVASSNDDPSVSGKGRLRSAIREATPASITLASSDVGGAQYVFSNKFCLMNPARIGGVVVYFTSSNTVLSFLNLAITIPEGAICGTFAFRSYGTGVPTSVTITATANGSSLSASVKVGPVAISRVTVGATEIGSNGTITTNRVELNGPAPAGGMVITLTSSSHKLKVPDTMTIPAGITSNAFTIVAGLVSGEVNAVITASHSAKSKATTSIRVLPVAVKSMLLTPSSTSGGVNVLVKVYLNGPAPAGGLPVALNSSNPTVLPLPSTITVPAGATELGIIGRLSWVLINTALTVTASTDYGSVTGPITAIPTQMAGIVRSVTSVITGAKVTLSLCLSGPAPAGGMTVTLSSSASSLIAVPATVIIPGGTSTRSIVVTAGIVTASTPVTVKGIAGGIAKSVAVTVTP